MNKNFFWFLIGFMTVSFAVLFLPFYSEILMAAVFAFALEPTTRRLASARLFQKSSLYFRRKQWVAITLAALMLLVSIPLIVAIYHVYDAVQQIAAIGFQNTDFYKDVLEIKKVINEYASQLVSTFNLKRSVDINKLGESFINELGQDIMTYSGQIISQLPQITIYLFVFCCALYYFLAEHRQIKGFLLKSNLISSTELERLVLIFQKTSSSTLFASLIVGLIQASVVAIGSVLLKTGDFFVIFVFTFFLSFIPVIGAAPVAIFLAMLNLIKQDMGLVVGFLVVAVIAGTVDNLVRPWLVGSGEDIHPVIVLLAIIGAIVILGLPGLFIGPVLASATVQLYKVYILGEPLNTTPASTQRKTEG